jgi:hypothetical protein
VRGITGAWYVLGMSAVYCATAQTVPLAKPWMPHPGSELAQMGVSVTQTLRQDHGELVVSLVIVNSGNKPVSLIPELCKYSVGGKLIGAESQSDIRDRLGRQMWWRGLGDGPGAPPTTTHTDTVSGRVNSVDSNGNTSSSTVSGTVTHTEVDQTAYERQKEAYQERRIERAREVDRETGKIAAQQIAGTIIPPGKQIAGSLRFAVNARGKAGILELAFDDHAYEFQIPKSLAPR